MRTPPKEDEYPADSPQPQPLRRRRSLAGSYHHAKISDHPDDQPGVPRVRRASLYQKQNRPAVHNKPEDEEPEQKPAGGRKQEAYSSERKMPVSPKRRRHIYTASPPVPYSPRIPPKRSLRDHLRYLGPGQPIIIISVLLLAAIIIGMLSQAIVRSQEHSPSNTQSAASNQHATPPAQAIVRPANPHELIITPDDTDHPPPPVFATSAYLIDADSGATLYAYHPFMHLPMLSTTKLMTAVIAVERGNPDQKITITGAMEHDIQQLSPDSSLAGLKQGETYTLRELLYALLLVSGNDAAVVIADAVGGNLSNFVAEMNQKAQQLGLYDTHFANPHGLEQPGQYSSAHDLAFLGRYALSIPLIHQISGTQIYTIPQGGHHPQHILINGNQFMWWYPGVDGGKPGWDGASDFVQVISCVRNHRHLIAVVMNTNNWWTDMRDLLNWGFDDFNWISPYDVDLHQPIPYDDLWNYFTSDKKENTIPTADHGRYYIYTGYSISGSIMHYFDSHGGLKTFGYPVSMVTVTGNQGISQRFQKSTIQCNMSTNQCSTA